jgi:predicted Zn-dependent peptidase
MTSVQSSSPRRVVDLDAHGVRVLLLPNRDTEIVAVRVYARGGALHLDAATAGAEALQARAARRGTRRFTKERLNAELARRGIDLGTAVAHDFTVHNLRCLRRHFDAAWDAFTDVMLDPLLEPSEVDIVRAQLLVDIAQRTDSPDGALVERARAHCYAAHPYLHDPHGSAAAVAGLDATRLRAHATRVWSRANLLVVAAGDLDEDDLVRRVSARLGVLPAGTAAPVAPPLRFARGHLVIEPRALPTQYVLGEFAAPSLADADYHAALLALAVLRDRFFEEVRTKRNLSYAPSASLGHDAANLGSIYVTSTDPSAALAVMREEMRALMETALPASDLRDKVRVYVTRYHLQNETLHAQAGFLASHALLAGDWERSREFVDCLEAQTPADLQRVAQRMLHDIQYVVLGDPARVDARDYVDP